MDSIKLKVKGAKTAVYQESIFFLSGFMIIKKEVITSSGGLVELLEHKKINQLDLLNSELKGEFLLIIQEESKYTIVTDIVRSKPAFIAKTDEGFVITDDLQNVANKRIDEEKVSIFIESDCLFGSNNCYKHIYTCQAGEVVTIGNGEIQSERYFEFIPEPNSKKMEVDQFVSTFNLLMEEIIERMVESAPEVNNWLIPLSGGHDSRIMVNSLKKAGIENVICFSYGTSGNLQSKISKQIADAVGYDWHFIESTEHKWGQLQENGMIDEYVDYSFQGISTPHLQDFLAVYELKKRNIISDNDIFLPGHTPVTGSGYTSKTENFQTREQALDHIQKRFLNSTFKSKEEAYFYLDNILGLSRIDKKHLCAYINWQERRAKFIINSCRVYEFFGCDFRLPFWDLSLVKFWLSVAPEDRINRNLYKRSDREGILLDYLAKIPFESELNSESGLTDFKQYLKTYIPIFLTVFLLRLSGRKQKTAEGMNLIYAQKGKTVGEIIAPIEDFPRDTHSLIKPYIKRYPYQINAHLLSNLFALRRAYDLQKSI